MEDRTAVASEVRTAHRILAGMSPAALLIAALALSMPFSRAAISLLTAMILILWIAKSKPWKGCSLSNTPKLILAMAAYVAFGLISLLWSEDIPWGLDILGMYLYWLVIPAIAFLLRKEDINPVISAFLIGMAISQILFWGRHFGLWELKHGLTPFMNTIEYGVYLCVTILVLITRAMSSKYRLRTRFLYGAYLTITTVALFTSPGLTGQVAFVAAVPFAFILYTKATSKKPVFSSFAVVLLVASVFAATWKLSPVFQTNIDEFEQVRSVLAGENISESLTQSSVGQRTAMIIIGCEIFVKQPLLGTGFGDTMHDFQRILKERHQEMASLDGFSNTHLHTMYIEVATRIGIVGLILFGIVFYYYFTLAVSDKETNKLRTLFAIAFLAAFIGEPLWHKQFSMALFSLFTALFVLASKQDENAEMASPD
ncbi:MAG: O-antigen ligase family protein [Gammaproteobacteria bacterium]|nr:O-antigen ligase family protein [Gammaproteobacteria bacterium]MBU1656278.1 O-antigen ligase family protein [Gammaproteobacteria bacterium]MBU1959843.1 O-antigen ligase family protein [Gammaproteobacteria bacterium]